MVVLYLLRQGLDLRSDKWQKERNAEKAKRLEDVPQIDEVIGQGMHNIGIEDDDWLDY